MFKTTFLKHFSSKKIEWYLYSFYCSITNHITNGAANPNSLCDILH